MIEADPIGADESIVRTRRELSALSGRPDGRTAWRSESPSSYSMIDELAAAAERLCAAAARLRLTDLLGLFARAWVAVWAIGILFGLLTTLMPLVIFVAGFLIIFVGAWMFWRAWRRGSGSACGGESRGEAAASITAEDEKQREKQPDAVFLHDRDRHRGRDPLSVVLALPSFSPRVRTAVLRWFLIPRPLQIAFGRASTA